MKKIIGYSVVFVLLLFVVFSCKGKGKESKKEDIRAIVYSITGKVSIKKAGKTDWTIANVNDTLGEGDYIMTGSRAKAVLKIGEDSFVKILPNSKIKISMLIKTKEQKEKIALDINIGNIIAKPKKLISGESFSAITPTAVIGVRGTEFLLTIDDSGNTRTIVKEGVVRLKRKIDTSKLENVKSAKVDEIKKVVSQEVEVPAGKEAVVKKDENKKIEKKLEVIATKKEIEDKDIEEVKKVAKVNVSDAKKSDIKVIEEEIKEIKEKKKKSNVTTTTISMNEENIKKDKKRLDKLSGIDSSKSDSEVLDKHLGVRKKMSDKKVLDKTVSNVKKQVNIADTKKKKELKKRADQTLERMKKSDEQSDEDAMDSMMKGLKFKKKK